MNRTEFIKKSGLAMGLVPLMNRTLTGKTITPPGAKIVRKSQGRTYNVVGDNMTFKLTGKETGGQFTFIEEYNDPGTAIPLHIHENEDEIFRVLEGELKVDVDGKKTILKAGDMAFCPRGVPHSWRVTGDKKAKVDLNIFPAGIEDMFVELSKLPPGPPDMIIVSEICGNYGVKFL